MLRYLSELWRDAVYGARMLANAPGFTAVGILSLTLGIGVCSVFFSQINALVLRPLPQAREPEALVALETLSSYPYFEQYRDHGGVAESTTAFTGPVPISMVVDGAGTAKAERVFGHLVSPEYFDAIGVTPAMGRCFRPDTEKEGTAPADVFLPATSTSVAPELGSNVLHRREEASFRVVLRLRKGVTMQSAEAALDALRRHLDDEAAIPESDRKGRQVRLLPAGGLMPMPADQRYVTYTFVAVLMALILSLA